MERPVRTDLPGVRRRRWPGAALAPYLLVLPGWLWLAAFFVAPVLVMVSLSLQTGDFIEGFRQTFHFGTYADVVRAYHVQLLRSLLYGAVATVCCAVIAYPVAYWIAFRGGRHKSAYLFAVLLPFFVSFVIRTQSWNVVLADNGVLLGPLKRLGVLPGDFHVLATPYAVIGGLAYNFLPFMVLPVYVALERLDPRLTEAAADLYAGRVQGFLRVVLPLSLPGVFAGVLLTFVPASADYVNASILGGPSATMVGNVIQTEYFTNLDYPGAAALSFVLMAALLLAVFGYARALGTRDVLEAAAR
ncbi:binding-protein-dependent transport systems inner membrane component (plasmid) [Streptantibioticus cattleyicolor NRRL 8057 = DSM 46488]|uniref:Binding-protein-dependent transport systems inner membrane component n=1 Tax=Streptantibioticus cattleyicolor (strain ATCC 35852 / DSM 46488 / JCM 4925 / NBRC 14057 / NRRL 8057) TaxID=1003195 RepID=G8XHC1_STREN|nr:binding-protein-dependent transport systems inner membrane component [Streptantibioticus cattleyicolor NRRL 8057 = DSM 46488]